MKDKKNILIFIFILFVFFIYKKKNKDKKTSNYPAVFKEMPEVKDSSPEEWRELFERLRDEIIIYDY